MQDGSKSQLIGGIGPGAVVADRYEITDRVGNGGMGIVFRAVDRQLNDEVVALKILHPHLAQDEQIFARFRNEVLVARSLTHPNLVRIHDIGRTSDGVSYITMEFVRGYSLDDRLAKRGDDRVPQKTLSFSEAVSVLYHVVCAVAYAHDKGIIHRDLKPANVMIGEGGEVKLADFGTARIMSGASGITQTGQSIGTPDYMSPEQIRGEELDAACDIYALGIIAFELVAGKKPFTADTPVAIAFKHLNEPVPELDVHGINVPYWFKKMVKTATEKDKSKRFQSAREMASLIAENVPELAESSSLYVGGTTFRGTPQTNGSAPAEKTERSEDSRFELGGEIEDGTTSQRWEIGGGTVPSLKPSDSQATKRSPFLTFVVLPVLVLAVGVAVVRTDDTSREFVRGKIAALESDYDTDLAILYNLFGVSKPSDLERLFANLPEEDKQAVEATKAADPERERMTLELLGGELPEEGAADTKQVASKAETSSAEENESAKQEVEKATEKKEVTTPVKERAQPKEEPTKVASVEKKAEQKLVEKKEPPKEKLPPAPPPVESLSAVLMVKEKGASKPSYSFSVDKLYDVRWEAVVSGASERYQKLPQTEVQKEYQLEFVDSDGGTKTFQLLPDSLKRNGSRLELAGRIASARSKGLEAGTYRAQFVRTSDRKGREVLATQRLNFYKAKVTLSTPKTSSIGTGSSAITLSNTSAQQNELAQEEKQEVEERTEETKSNTAPIPALADTSSSAQVVQREAAEPPAARSGAVDLLARPSNEPTVENGDLASLPPARGYQAGSEAAEPVGRSRDQFNRSSIELNQSPAGLNEPAQVILPPEPVVPAENYSGTLKYAGGESKQLTLSIRIKDDEISGTANVSGVGELQAFGKIFPRGLEITLRKPDGYGIRLTGAQRGKTIRGRFSIPSEQARGSFQASK